MSDKIHRNKNEIFKIKMITISSKYELLIGQQSSKGMCYKTNCGLPKSTTSCSVMPSEHSEFDHIFIRIRMVHACALNTRAPWLGARTGLYDACAVLTSTIALRCQPDRVCALFVLRRRRRLPRHSRIQRVDSLLRLIDWYLFSAGR